MVLIYGSSWALDGKVHRTMTLYYQTRSCIQADHIPSRYRFVLLKVVVVQHDVDVRGC